MSAHTETARFFLPPGELLPPDPDARDRTTPDYFEFFNRLRDDVARRNIRQDLLATTLPDGRRRVLAGETRRQVALSLGLATVPVQIVEALTPGQRALETYLENRMRKNLTPLEDVAFWQTLMATNEWTQAELAVATGESASAISKAITVRDSLTDEEVKLVESGKLPFRGAYSLVKAFASPAERQPWVQRLAARQLTCDALDYELSKLRGGRKAARAKPVKVTTGRKLVLTIPGEITDAASLLAELAAMSDTVRRCEKNSLPLSSLPQLVKGGA